MTGPRKGPVDPGKATRFDHGRSRAASEVGGIGVDAEVPPGVRGPHEGGPLQVVGRGPGQVGRAEHHLPGHVVVPALGPRPGHARPGDGGVDAVACERRRHLEQVVETAVVGAGAEQDAGEDRVGVEAAGAPVEVVGGHRPRLRLLAAAAGQVDQGLEPADLGDDGGPAAALGRRPGHVHRLFGGHHVEPVHGGQTGHEVAAGADVGGQAVLPVEGDHLIGHRLPFGVLLEAERGPSPHEGGPDQRRVVVAPGGGDRPLAEVAMVAASPAWSRLVASIPSSRTRSGDRSS